MPSTDEHIKAVRWYEEAIASDPNRELPFYENQDLAESYEAVGKNEAAIRIHRKMIRHWEANGELWLNSIVRSQEAIQRLSE